MSFPLYRQLDSMDCGPTCLRMVAKHYGRAFSVQSLREASQIGKDGVNLLGISEAAECIGLKSLAVKITLKTLINATPLPCIVHWNQRHFVVVYKTTKTVVFVADPAGGLLKYTLKEFEKCWLSTVSEDKNIGIALLLEPTINFKTEKFDLSENDKTSLGFSQLYNYLFKYKKLLFQLVLGLLVGSVLQLILPFLTQSVVDTGIQTRNLHFIYLVLIAQLLLFMGRMSVEFIRSWILLHISTRINLSILSDFFGKTFEAAHQLF